MSFSYILPRLNVYNEFFIDIAVTWHTLCTQYMCIYIIESNANLGAVLHLDIHVAIIIQQNQTNRNNLVKYY